MELESIGKTWDWNQLKECLENGSPDILITLQCHPNSNSFFPSKHSLKSIIKKDGKTYAK